MSNCLLTGVSGYLGGDLLAQLQEHPLPQMGILYGLVRTAQQAVHATRLGAVPVELDISNGKAISEFLIANNIRIVFFLIDSQNSEKQQAFIRALADVKIKSGQEVHFLHTTGAKMFSSLAGAPWNRQPLPDNAPDLYDVQTEMARKPTLLQKGVQTNIRVIELAERLGVRSYIFAPCIVYDAAKGAGCVCDPNPEAFSWPVCHIKDNSGAYVALLRSILVGGNPGHGKEGFYLASSGSVPWSALYRGMARGLKEKGTIQSDTVAPADDVLLAKMAAGLRASKEWVIVLLGGQCNFQAQHAASTLDWEPIYAAQHAIDDMPREARFIVDQNA